MSKKLLIIGDLLIDKTYYVSASKISPEAPCLVAYMVDKEPIITPGGAGLGASYAHKKNIPYRFATSINQEYKDLLQKKGININILFNSDNIEKIRYIDKESSYHILRVDTDRIKDRNEWQIKEELNLKNISAIVCLDYNKGIFTKNSICKLIKMARLKNIPIYFDSRQQGQFCKNTNVLKINKKEYNNLCLELDCNSKYDLKDKLKLDILIVTKGSEGASYIIGNNEFNVYPPIKIGIPDVTGCGDVFDISFCYYYYLKRYELGESVQAAVDAATEHAYTPIKTRLC